MIDVTNPRTTPREPPVLGSAIDRDGTIASWVRQTMDRANEAGIDPRRVGLALGIPARTLDEMDETAPPGQPTR